MLDLNSKDTDYLKAVRNGVMETAQGMVDEVAEEWTKNSNGFWLYSFAIEKGTAPQTLLAVVTDNKSTTVPNNSIADNSKNVNQNEKGYTVKAYHGTGADFNVFNIW